MSTVGTCDYIDAELSFWKDPADLDEPGSVDGDTHQTSSPEKKKPRVQGCGVAGFFGVFFPGEMQWGSRGKTRVALCTLGKHFVTLSLGKVTSGSNA